MSEQTQTKTAVGAACITGILACFGTALAAVVCLGVLGLGLSYMQRLASPPEDCSIFENLSVPFTGGYDATYTRYSYTGRVFVTVSGTGQSSGTQYTDAFYLYTDGDGQSIRPEHPADWILTINGDRASELIPNREIPSYRPDHVYHFEIVIPEGILSFGVRDGFASDNTGSYSITLCQL